MELFALRGTLQFCGNNGQGFPWGPAAAGGALFRTVPQPFKSINNQSKTDGAAWFTKFLKAT